jgi:MSHA biogenesis protein MshJ
MKQWWLQQSARINALSLRERAFIFVSLIASCLALADALWLSPAMGAHQLQTQQHAAQNAELRRLRTELQSMPAPVDVNLPLRTELAALQQQLVEVQSQVTAAAGGNSPALEPVLAEFLRRRPELMLLSTATLSADAAAGKAAATTTGIARRGVELKVSGPYAELVKYVRSLEQALPNLRWGPMQLRSEKQPPELTLQVFVLEVQP